MGANSSHGTVDICRHPWEHQTPSPPENTDVPLATFIPTVCCVCSQEFLRRNENDWRDCCSAECEKALAVLRQCIHCHEVFQTTKRKKQVELCPSCSPHGPKLSDTSETTSFSSTDSLPPLPFQSGDMGSTSGSTGFPDSPSSEESPSPATSHSTEPISSGPRSSRNSSYSPHTSHTSHSPHISHTSQDPSRPSGSSMDEVRREAIYFSQLHEKKAKNKKAKKRWNGSGGMIRSEIQGI